jgi:hypothetical protein
LRHVLAIVSDVGDRSFKEQDDSKAVAGG